MASTFLCMYISIYNYKNMIEIMIKNGKINNIIFRKQEELVYTDRTHVFT